MRRRGSLSGPIGGPLKALTIPRPHSGCSEVTEKQQTQKDKNLGTFGHSPMYAGVTVWDQGNHWSAACGKAHGFGTRICSIRRIADHRGQRG